ncbi:MAG: alpha/beta hydrolase [Rhodobacteraceae bacterium]|nr:alpha/beta hydrolase [Paracoccaceae bacterium]
MLAKIALIIGITLALVAVVAVTSANKREAAARAAWPPVGQILEVDGVKVHAWVKGQGPDLVMLHGAGGNLREFTFALTDLLTDRYRVILMDRPGLGYSDRSRPEYASPWATQAETPQEQAHILATAARQLGAERPIVLGHSFGGAVALAWALDHDPAALVLVSAVSMPWPGSLSSTYTLLGARPGDLIVPLAASAFMTDRAIDATLTSIFEPQAVPAGYAAHIGPRLSVQRTVLRANARQVLGLRPEVVEMSKRYDRLSLPIEVLHGDADTIVPIAIHARPFSEMLPSANLTELRGAGHMPHHFHTEAVIKAINTAHRRSGR